MGVDSLTTEHIESGYYFGVADDPEVGWATQYKGVYRYRPSNG
jgi:hypothetical protein